MSRGCDPEPKMPTQSIIESQAACGVHVWGEHVCANSKDKAIGKRSKGGLSKVRFRCGACGRVLYTCMPSAVPSSVPSAVKLSMIQAPGCV